MPVTEVYLDTSALIKLYVPEAFSTEVERLVADVDVLVISRLTVMLEWHCAMSRRLRAGLITRPTWTLHVPNSHAI